MSKENRSAFAILGMLDLGPLSGYDIRKFAAVSIAHFWKEDYSHIYPTLKLLVAQGLATKKDDSIEGKIPKHVYSITDKGREILAQWLSEMPNPPNLRIELLLKVFFGSRSKPEYLAAMLRKQEAACHLALVELDKTERLLKQESGKVGSHHRDARFQLMTLQYGKSYYENFGSWCRETLDELSTLPKETDLRNR